MAIDLKNYEPALMAGGNIGVAVDLTDIVDNNGNEVVEIDGVSSAVNYLGIRNAATGNNPILYNGGEADTGITLAGSDGTNTEEILILDANATAVNEVTIDNAAAGSNPAIAATGDDTNIGLQLTSKGTGLALIGDSGSGTVASGSVTINAQRGKMTIALTTGPYLTETTTLVNNKIGSNSLVLMTLEQDNITAGLPYLSRFNIVDSGSAVITFANGTSVAAVAGTAIVNFLVLS